MVLTTYMQVALCSERLALLATAQPRRNSSSCTAVQLREGNLQRRKCVKVAHNGDTLHSTKNRLQGIVLSAISCFIDQLTQPQLLRWKRRLCKYLCAFIVRKDLFPVAFLFHVYKNLNTETDTTSKHPTALLGSGVGGVPANHRVSLRDAESKWK